MATFVYVPESEREARLLAQIERLELKLSNALDDSSDKDAEITQLKAQLAARPQDRDREAIQ